jgi:hypothetical protein
MPKIKTIKTIKGTLKMLNFETGNIWETLQQNVQSTVKIQKEKKDYNDPRMWKLTRDESDRGSALIRLLPDQNNVPYVAIYSHSFSTYDPVKKKQRWFIQNSPETIGLPSPASQLWAALFEAGKTDPRAKEESRNFNRKIAYYSNVKVLSDPANKQNNGNIYIWSYGTRMFEKFLAANQPSEQELELGVKPKDLWNPLRGNSILLKIKMGSNKIPTYDDTSIEESSSIYENNSEGVEDIMSNAHKLNDLLAPESFETYEELKKHLLWVLECYQPKFLSKPEFDAILAKAFGDAPIESTKATVSEPVVKEAPKQEPKVIPTEVAKPNVQEEDDLSFLDSLENL